jgi:hypothetical protein
LIVRGLPGGASPATYTSGFEHHDDRAAKAEKIITNSQRIKVATFASVSILRNQGHLRVKDASEKELQDQIEGFRDRFFHHEARCKGLVANFQMLKPLLKNESLKKRLVREGKGNVGSRLVTVLFEACILDCQTLVADNDDFNPSLRTLVRPFLSRNRQKNRTLLERLASFHTERPITLNKRQRAARLRRFDRNCRPARSGLGSPY